MTTMTDDIKRLRLTILIVSLIAFLSLFSLTMTVFAWGAGENTGYFFIFYLVLLVSIIFLLAKKRIGYYFIVVISLAYILLLNRDIGDYFIFKFDNEALLFIIFLPYLCMLFLIPLTALFLASESKYKQLVVVTSLITVLAFPTYAIAERFNMDYSDSICMDFDIKGDSLVKITGKPGFADTRQFTMTSNSKDLIKAIKDEGELFYGSYVFVNTRIKKKFRFQKFQSLTIKRLKDKKLEFDLTWTSDQISGDISFLSP